MFRSTLHASTDRVLESHQRKLVDCSDPASETKRPERIKKRPPVSWALCVNRLDLNHPPTSVGGIRKFREPTYVGRTEQSTHSRGWDFEAIISFIAKYKLSKNSARSKLNFIQIIVERSAAINPYRIDL